MATPIGNLEDITQRALRILKEVDLILCEDTRQSRKLLDHYRIEKSLESFFEHNEAQKTAQVIKMLEEGKNVALVSDGGTPLISDPGYRLVRVAIKKGVVISPVPGSSAVTTALVASGLPLDQFIFVGFLPQKPGQRRNFLEKIREEKRTLVAFESPNRLLFALNDILEVLGDRHICVAREMTKVHEEFARGRVSEIIKSLSGQPIKGEITLIVEGQAN